MSIQRSGLRDRDGKSLIVPNALPEWAILNLAGAGDTDAEIGAGNAFQLSKTGVGDESVEFSFCDCVYLMGGSLVLSNAKLGDYIDFRVYAPASVLVENAGAGNCNSVPTGLGFNIIVPAADEDGGYDVDLESRDASIVPNTAKTGYWDWDCPTTGLGTVTPNPGSGSFDLYPVGMNLSQFTQKLPLLGDNVSLDLGIQNVRPKMIPPHWKWGVTLHSATASNETQAVFYIVSGRARTFLNPVIT